MADSLELEEDLLSEEASITTIAQWDSLRHLRLIMALQEEFGVRFEDIEIPELTSFRAVRDAITGKLISHGREE